jgi:hypothetical protein
MCSKLDELRTIQEINFREPQPLNSRTVYKSVALGNDQPNSSKRVYANYLLVGLAFFRVLLQ